MPLRTCFVAIGSRVKSSADAATREANAKVQVTGTGTGFLSVFDPVVTHFRTHRHRIFVAQHRVLRKYQFWMWGGITGLSR